MKEDHAFWAWAIIEVLRATGIRVEELLELTHHSLVQYRLPDHRRAGAAAADRPVQDRRRAAAGRQPRARRRAQPRSSAGSAARDGRSPAGPPPTTAHELRLAAAGPAAVPAPDRHREPHDHRQRRRHLLDAALARTGLTDPATGGPLRFTPHDFRRMFITDAILNGLPPHIAQVIAGHRDINVTMGYKAVYPDEAIQAHLAFLARRRALRPTEEYRVPTDEEWQQFLGHFERRKVSTGTCGRAFGTPCIHEHACIRCPMLWPDPAQRDRLAEIRDNLHRPHRRSRARRLARRSRRTASQPRRRHRTSSPRSTGEPAPPPSTSASPQPRSQPETGNTQNRTIIEKYEFREYGVIVELDGQLAHSVEDQWRDKARDNAAAVDGRQSLRYGWTYVHWHPCATALQVAAVLWIHGWAGWPRPCSPGCPVERALSRLAVTTPRVSTPPVKIQPVKIQPVRSSRSRSGRPTPAGDRGEHE